MGTGCGAQAEQARGWGDDGLGGGVGGEGGGIVTRECVRLLARVGAVHGEK